MQAIPAITAIAIASTLSFDLLAATTAEQASTPVTIELIEVLGNAGGSSPLERPSDTGSRLGLSLLETPASVNTIDSATMRERGFTTTLQALDSVVGVQSGQCFGLVCFSTRGFAGTTSLPFLFNGNRYPGLAMSPRSTFNYERIDIIKGPSSVLHGFGAATGAVNYVTKKADGREETEIEVSAGSSDTYSVGLGKGGRLDEATAYRIDGHFVNGNKGSYGFVDRSSYEDYHLSGEITHVFSDSLSAAISLDSFKDQGEGYFGTPVVDGKIDESVDDNNYNIGDDRISKKVFWASLKLNWQISDQLSLINETYGNNEDRLWQNAEGYSFNPSTGQVDRGDFLHISHDQRIYGNRTDLVFNHFIGDMHNRVVVGYDYSYNRHQRDNNSPYGGSDTIDFANPAPGLFYSPDPFSSQRRTEVASQGFYVEDFLKLSDAFSLSLSLRHDVSDLDSFDLRADSDFSKHYSANSWRIGTLYAFNEQVVAYAQLSRAFEPPSQIVTLAESRSQFDLTEIRQQEIGVKGSFADGRVNATLALYDISRTNILTRDPVDPTKRSQIGEQSSQGIEIDVAYAVSPALSISANMSLLDAQYDDYIDKSGTTAISREGNIPTDVPEKTANLWLAWRPSAEWKAGAGMHYIDRRAANRGNTVFMGSYTLFDAYVGRSVGQGELTLHVRNITDEIYANHSYGDGQFMLGEPRGFTLSWYRKY